MVNVYANRIMSSNGAYTLENVPGYIREDVRKVLIERGFIKTEEAKDDTE